MCGTEPYEPDLPLIDRLYLSNLPEPKRKRQPEELLAEILTEAVDRQYRIDPENLARIIRTQWSKIAPLAHAIHDGPKAEKRWVVRRYAPEDRLMTDYYHHDGMWQGQWGYRSTAMRFTREQANHTVSSLTKVGGPHVWMEEIQS